MIPAGTSPTPDATCEGCRVSVRLAPGEVDRLVAEALAATPQPLASPEVAAARLVVCRTCPDLQYGTTCRHCGCLVEVRVHMSAKDCPAPSPRW